MALTGGTVADVKPESPDGERRELVRLTERFLQAVGSGDVEFLERHLYPEARFVHIEEGAEGPSISWNSASLLMDAVPRWRSKVRERIWDPAVLIDGRIGLVWARYDYHLEGRFSHCGTDLFTFMKTADGWLMTSGSWTVEKQGCKERPREAPEKD